MSEATEQKEFVTWWRATYPEYAHCLRVSLTGLNFGAGPKAARMVNHIRSQGITVGESDILIALGRGGWNALVIEHKAADGKHKVTPEQQAYLDAHAREGNCALSTRGIESLKAAVMAYMDAKYV